MIVEVPVLGRIEVPDDMPPDEVMRIVGEFAGVDTSKPISDWDAFTRGLERGITGTTRGIGQVLTRVTGRERTAPPEDIQYDPMGNVISGGTAPSVQEVRKGESATQADIRKELEYELAKLQGNKAASYGGYVLGTLFDPANLIGGLGAPTMKALVAEGAITGAVQGFFDPLYGTEDTTANRLFGAAVGAPVGGALGFGLGKLFRVDKPAVTTGDKSVNDTIVVEPEPQTVLDNAKVQAQTVDNTTANDPFTITLPSLPAFLQPKTAPTWGKSEIAFETDLDKALWDFAKSKGQRKTDLELFLTNALNTDSATVNKLAQNIRNEVIDIAKGTQITEGGAPKIPFKMSRTLDNFINPVDKNLDEMSKMVYNYGAKLGREENGKFLLNLNKAQEDYSFQQISKMYSEQGIIASPYDIALDIKGYNKMLDELKRIEGPNYKPKSFDDYALRGMSIDEELALTKAGAFDGC